MTFQYLHEYAFFLICIQTLLMVLRRSADVSSYDALLLNAGAVALVTNSVILGLCDMVCYGIIGLFVESNRLHPIVARYFHLSLQLVWAWVAWSTVHA